MTVIINGKTTTFDDKAISSLDYKEFEAMCLGMPVFKELALNERTVKIREVYGNITGNVEKVKKSGHDKDIHSSNESGIGTGSGYEQKPIVARVDIKGEEDKTEIQKQKVRAKEKKTKL